MTLVQVREKENFTAARGKPAYRIEEALAFCPGCKALQTVWLDGQILMPTQKYKQVGKNIYHNCGYPQPCRLY